MSEQEEIEKSDSELFREAIGRVNPVKHDVHVEETEKPKPWPTQRVADERQTLLDMASGLHDPEILETGDELYFKREGVQNRLFQRLKRGQIPCERVLDLHGMTIAVAKEAFCDFLLMARKTNWRCVRIIHGKGKGSRDGIAVLKGKVEHWLRQRDEILAFSTARPVDGGTGAMYVLIRR
ncbi:MAG: DNA mismatch repair protein MutS [Gammaproteobacteria bacterium]|nr:DNA mismatch repair protein MutS [Gammaproteobacteria bacterium]